MLPPLREGQTKRISPLNEAQTELCIQAIREFRAGLSQALLYTPGTVQFERVCEGTFAALTRMLEASGAFKLGVIRGQVLVNGERMETPTGLRGQLEYIENIMFSAGVGSVRFNAGLAYAELGPFLQLLARKRLPRVESTKANEFLREQGIQHLEVDDLRYVELKGEERVISGEGTFLSNNVAAHQALSDLVDAMLASIERVQDPVARDQLRAETADQLMEKSEAMMPSLLATSAQRLKQAASDEHIALAAIPPRDGRLLQYALEAAKGLPASGAETAREALRELIEQLARPYQARSEDLLAHTCLRGAVSGLVPDWLLQAEASLAGNTAEEKLRGILCQSPGALLSEQMFPHVVDVLDELCVAGLEAEAEQLTKHVAGAARAPTKRERMKAVERLSYLLGRLLEQSTAPIRVLEDALLEACTHETSEAVLELLGEHLSRRCAHHYRLGNWRRALEHLQWIANLEESWRLALRDEGANIARKAREALAKSDFARALPGDLLAEGEHGAAVVRMLQVLGVSVWSSVIDCIRAETNTARAQRLAACLCQIGPEALRLFYIALGREADGPTALRLLELTRALQDDPALWAELPALLHHADGQVRDRTLEIVVARTGGVAVEALLDVLRTEGDAPLRRLWIQALARMHDPMAEQMLLDELNKAAEATPPNEALLLPLFEVLSAAGQRGIIDTVVRLLQHHGQTIVLGSGSAPPRTVVMAAIKALAPFYRDPAPSELLERLRKDRDPEIARLALVCLRGVVAAQRQAAQAALPTEAPAPAEPVAEAPLLRKSRRAFELLEASEDLAEQFKAGAAVGGRAEARPPEPAAAKSPLAEMLAMASAHQDAEPSLEGLKPIVEGLLEDFGLAATVRMVGGKDGVLRISGTAAEGRVYIQNHKVMHARFAEERGPAALTAMAAMKGARFAYFHIPFSLAATLDLGVAGVSEALKQGPPR